MGETGERNERTAEFVTINRTPEGGVKKRSPREGDEKKPHK